MLHQIDSLFDFLYHTKLRPALDILRTHQITVKSQLVCPPLLDTSLVAHRHHSSTAKRKCSAAPPQPGLQKAPRNDVTLSKQPVIPPIPPLCLEPTIFPAVSSTEIEYLYLDSLVPEDAKLCDEQLKTIGELYGVAVQQFASKRRNAIMSEERNRDDYFIEITAFIESLLLSHFPGQYIRLLNMKPNGGCFFFALLSALYTQHGKVIMSRSSVIEFLTIIFLFIMEHSAQFLPLFKNMKGLESSDQDMLMYCDERIAKPFLFAEEFDMRAAMTFLQGSITCHLIQKYAETPSSEFCVFATVSDIGALFLFDNEHPVYNSCQHLEFELAQFNEHYWTIDRIDTGFELVIVYKPSQSMEDIIMQRNTAHINQDDDIVKLVSDNPPVQLGYIASISDSLTLQVPETMNKESSTRNFENSSENVHMVEAVEEVYGMNEPSLTQQLIDLRYHQLDGHLLNCLREILDSPATEEIIQDKYNTVMTRRKLVCLKPNTWLNDEVINFYMNMLIDRDNFLCEKFPGRRKSHFFNSFFVERLMKTDKKYNYSNVKRWSKKFDIFELDKIFFPINIDDMHWTLSVVYPQSKEIHYLDSMRGTGHFYMEGLRKWIVDEAAIKNNITLDPCEWTLISRSHEIPQQGNDFDCGAFAIIGADFLSDNLPLNEQSYSQSNFPFFREKIGCDILKGSLAYPLDTIVL